MKPLIMSYEGKLLEMKFSKVFVVFLILNFLSLQCGYATSTSDSFSEDVKTSNIEAEIVSSSVLASSSTLSSSEPDFQYLEGPTGNSVSPSANFSFQPDLFTGRASASVPIVVPPGRRNMQPAISLTYNSGSRNSWIGFGWNLDIGSIQRDTKKGVPRYGASDTFTFSLGGSIEELVKINSLEYRAKIESSFLRFRYVGNSWEVTDKDGTTYNFGSNDLSKVTNSSGIFKWCLDRVTDVNGNYMTLSYTKDNGQIYLSQVQYTGNNNTGDLPQHTIDFVLETRTDTPSNYISGSNIITAYRLKEIDIKINASRVKRYILGYSYSADSNHSLLKSVTQYDASDSSLPPIEFEYSSNDGSGYSFDAPGSGIWFEEDPANRFYLSCYFFGDFNGDGLADLLGYNARRDRWYVGLSDGSSFNAPGSGYWLREEFGDYEYPERYRIQDFNGDGMDDFLYNDPYSGYFHVRCSRGGGFENSQDDIWLDEPLAHGSFATHDFDGDGLADVLGYGHDAETGINTAYYLGISTGSSFRGPGSGYVIPADELWRADLFGDFNGDAVIDIMGQNPSDNNWYVGISTGTSFDAPESGLWSQRQDYVKRWRGDFNGDGLYDMMFHNWYHVIIGLSTGSSFDGQGSGEWVGADHTTNQKIADLQPPENQFMFQMFTWTSEFNGDSVTDITGLVIRSALDGDHESGRPRYIGLSDGMSLDAPGSGAWIVGPSNCSRGIPRDFNGDGMTDLAYYNYVDRCWDVRLNTCKPVDFLTKISNGIGGITTIAYEPSTKYANTLLPFAIQTISTVTVEDGIDSTPSYTTTYEYSDGYYNANEREFRGFGYAKATDPEGNYSETWFHQDSIQKGKAYREKVRDSGGRLCVMTEYEWRCDNNETDPPPYFPYLYQSDIYTYGEEGESGSFKQAKTRYQYDQYGNLTHVFQDGDVDLADDDFYTITEFVYNENAWILSKSYCTQVFDSNGIKQSENFFYYDEQELSQPPIKGKITKEEVWLRGDEVNNSITQYRYDEYGNLHITVDPKDNQTETVYDTDFHAFPAEIRNICDNISHIQRYTYDPKTGQILTLTDTNGQTTSKEYDGFGRVTRVISPSVTGQSLIIEYQYDLTGIPDANTPNKIAKTRTATTDGTEEILTSYTFFDGMGQVIQAKIEAENDFKQIVVNCTYNYRGQKALQYLPYIVNKSSNYITLDISKPKTTFQYDWLGRLIGTITPDDSTTHIEYNDANWETTTVNANNHKMKTTRDAFKRIIKVDEFISENEFYATIYEYNCLGNLIKVANSQQIPNITTMQYDTLGRKISMDDPDMGYWIYEYDMNGNLIRYTDAKGQIVEFTYDTLNRLRQKDYLGSSLNSVSYHYDSYEDGTTTNGIGRLTYVEYRDGRTTFYYDDIGRGIQDVKEIDGSTYAIHRNYDALDRISSIMYPDGEVVRYSYNKQGGVERIEGNTVYVQNVDYNAASQMTRIEYGNGTYTNYEYNPNTLRLNRLQTENSASQSIQNLLYFFDNVGNITDIQATLYSPIDQTPYMHSQSFTYDALNRLKTADSSFYGYISYEYDSIGNLTRKGNTFFNYGEGNTGPHALTSSTDSSILCSYDQNGNMIQKNDQIYEHDVKNRLEKVKRSLSGESTFVKELSSGWNFLSIPVMPNDTTVSAMLGSIDSKYDQVSTYNNGEFKHYIKNPDYDDFTNIEYGKGYQIFITDPAGAILTVTGQLPSSSTNFILYEDWSLISCPSTSAISKEDALNNLQLNVNYDRIVDYDGVTFVENPAILQPGHAYYIHILNTTTWQISQPAETVAEFVYDGDGGRIKKIASSGSTVYIGSSYEVNNGITTKHIFCGSNRIASKSSDGTLSYIHSDHLGSSNVITDDSGNVVQTLEYLPYGQTHVNQGVDSVSYKFTGKELDFLTGLYYYGARYYDPEIGRFIQPDTIIPDLFYPQELNRYTYAGNNPVIYTDPTGHKKWYQYFGFNKNPLKELWEEIKSPFIAAAAVVASTALMSIPGGQPFAILTTKATWVAAASAASATAVLDTGEGRQLIGRIGHEFFDDVLGMNPRSAHVASSIFIHTATTLAFEWGYSSLLADSATQVGQYDHATDGPIEGGGIDPYGDMPRGEFQKNQITTFSNASGDSVFVGKKPISGPLSRAKLTHIGARSTRGFGNTVIPVNRLTWATSATCHQVSNSVLLQAGFSNTILGMTWDTFLSTAIYGNYGGGLYHKIATGIMAKRNSEK